VDQHVLVTLVDGAVYRVELATGKATSIATSGSISPTIARDPGVGLGVMTRADRRVIGIDLASNTTWPLFSGMRSGTSAARITGDGQQILLVANNQHLLTWRVRLPQTPAETARWIDEITNATDEQGTTKLGWR
jgi:hypothetical protein